VLSTKNSNQQDRKGDRPQHQLTVEQATAFQQLSQLRSDIEEQCQRVAIALNPIAESLINGGNVSPDMMNHVKAQILKAHLQLDDLMDLLDSLP
jgi:hypothetical protein